MPDATPTPLRVNFRLAVLMTSHNRRETTLHSLEALFAQEGLPPELNLEVFLVDDGSSDGTGEAVGAQFPQVRVLPGDGSLYWAGGMRKAWQAAIDSGRFDAYLWLNDDTHLDRGAIGKTLRLHQSLLLKREAAILVGSTKDPRTGCLTYGGRRSMNRWNPLKLTLIQTKDDPVECDTFNGNFVWIPSEIVAKIGIIGNIFIHSLADIDYGFRARKAGFRLWLIPAAVGTCAKNHGLAPWDDPSLGLKTRWLRSIGPKYMPPSAWIPTAIRHGGWSGPLLAIWPYLKILIPPKMREP